MSRADVLVSVVMPTHDRPRRLPGAVASVLAQTHRALELIVVDDASRTDVSEIVGAAAGGDRRVELIRLPDPAGAAVARNTAIARAQGEFIAFLDDDDRWAPRKIERQLQAATEHPRAGIVICDFDVVDETTGGPPQRYRGPRSLGARHLWWFNIPGTFMCTFVRRSAVDGELWLDESFPSNEDWDLWVRCAQHTSITVVPEALATQILHRDGRLSDPASKLRGLEAFERRYGPSMSPACLAYFRAHERMELGTGWRKRANVARSLATRSPRASAYLLAEQTARQVGKARRDPGLVDRLLVAMIDRLGDGHRDGRPLPRCTGRHAPFPGPCGPPGHHDNDTAAR